ncbi:MAG: YitT family protein [bacterium]|nr:YitT family protein [bacterium]
MESKLKNIATKLWPWLVITFGCLISALGYVVFILPMQMVEGGVTGIGIIAKHITGLPIVGMTSLAITAVVFVVATRIMGKGFGAKSIYATILMNVSIDFMLLMKIPQITHDILLSAFYGGAIVGLGLGMVYFSGASTGGADAIAHMLYKLNRIPIGRTLIAIDILVLGGATLLYIPLEKIMYSLIFIYIEIKVIDMVLNGIRANQRVMIVTDYPEKMKSAIFDSLKRGLTIFTGTGGYSGAERYMLTTVLPKHNIPAVRRIIAGVDDKAFVIIQDIHQVYGEGFETLPTTKPVLGKKKNNISPQPDTASGEEVPSLES